MSDNEQQADPLRILRVSSDIYPDVSGGLGIHVHHLSREQGRRGHDVHVLAADRRSTESRRFGRRDGYTVRYHPELAAPLDNSLCPSLGLNLHRLADEFDVIHAHSHLFFSTNLAAVVGRMTDTPLVVTNHGVHSQTAPLWLQKLYLPTVGRLTLDAADAVICYTETDKRRLADLGVDARTPVIHNGVDCSTFRPQPGAGSKRQLLYVGRLKRAKGVHLLVRAFAQLCSDYPNLSLKLVGDGPERDALEALTTELGVREAVTFAGRVPNEQLPELYTESAVFVLPSRNEGMPRTVLEALACQTPAVTTQLDQLESVLADGGVTVPDPDPADLAASVASLLRDDERRREMGAAGRERVVEHHSWARTVERTIEEYYALVPDRRQPDSTGPTISPAGSAER